MPHKRHGLLLRSLRNRKACNLLIASVPMFALIVFVEPNGISPLQQETLQYTADLVELDAAIVDGAPSDARAETTIDAAQAADASDDVVGSVRKRVRKVSLKHRSKLALARKAAASKKAKLETMLRQDVKDRRVGKHALHGVASFYTYDTETASGEKFNPRAMVAAHRTLPFGTWIRVTDLDTDQSVTVRVNDRGPYVDGRIVDLTTAAAETLGITKRGLAKVKIDVVEGPANPVRVASLNGEFHSEACVDPNPVRPYSLALVNERLSGGTETTQ